MIPTQASHHPRRPRQVDTRAPFVKSILALTIATMPILASAEPLGAEFRVNTTTSNSQTYLDMAMDTDGDFVVVWQSLNQDGSSYGVYGQRYNASGVAQGTEFQVNTYTSNSQYTPAVAMDSDGDFVVAWQSSGQDGSSDGIYAQRYNASGVAQGSEFAVNTYTSGAQREASVAMDANGNFVIAWRSAGQDGSAYGIYAQRYDAAGVAQGSEFQVNTTTANSQRAPDIAMDTDGDFVIVWHSNGQDGSGYGIYGQRYNASGVAQGTEFAVNTYTSGAQTNAAVAMDSDGDFTVVWQSNGQDASGYGVYGQRFSADGTAQGSEFQVNTYTSSAQRDPDIAMDSLGNFAVAWHSNGQDGNSYGIYGQRYDAAGVAQGAEFQISTYTSGVQYKPAMDMDSDGDFAVGWFSRNQDGDNYGVYAQRFGTPDTTPDPFDFVDQTTAPLKSVVYSDIVTLSGFDTADTAISNGFYRLYSDSSSTWGAWTKDPGSVGPGDKIQLRTTADTTLVTDKTVTLTAGTATVDWLVRTEAADTVPDAFAFIDKTGQALMKYVQSNAVTPTGFNTPAAISISGRVGSQYRINSNGVWSNWTAAPGSLPQRAKVQVRTKSAATANTSVSATLTVGGVSDSFDVTTAP